VRRVAIIGASGSGKTTLAEAMAARLGVPHIEVDAIHHGPNWTEMPADEFRVRMAEVMSADGWVIDSLYQQKLGDMVLLAADTIVWLDLPLHVTMGRLARRTGSRYVRRTELWNGNRETLRGVLWGRESLFAWAIARHREYRRTLPPKFAGAAYRDTDVIRLRTERDVHAWLDRVSRPRADGAASAARAQP
jgi:adenylate kinase family enzyme